MGNTLCCSEVKSLVSSDGPTTSCPTCNGSGHVPCESESAYVALIPLTDTRLRPRRTLCKLLITVFLCFAASALLLLFLLPRSVELTSGQPLLLPSSVSISREGVVSLNVSNVFNFTNWNFVPVCVQNINVLSLYRDILITEMKVSLNSWVSLRGVQQFSVPLLLIFKSTVFQTYLAELCTINNTAFNQIYMSFAFGIEAFALGQKIESSLNTFQLVSCYTNLTPPYH